MIIPEFDKEAVYDSQISPLMTQIITICKEHKIPMLASFCLSPRNEAGDLDNYFCTTYLDGPDGWQPQELKRAIQDIRPSTVAFAVMVTKP